MMYFHPIIAAILLCYWIPIIGIPLLISMVIYYSCQHHFKQEAQDNDYE